MSYLHEWHMQQHNFLGPPSPGALGRGQRSNIIKSQFLSQFQTFLTWITCYIKRLIRKLAFRQHKKTNNIHYWNKYKTLRNKVITELRKSKQSYQDNLDQLFSGECNSKTLWKTSKQILKLGRVSASIPTLHHNGIYAESDHEKANL